MFGPTPDFSRFLNKNSETLNGSIVIGCLGHDYRLSVARTLVASFSASVPNCFPALVRNLSFHMFRNLGFRASRLPHLLFYRGSFFICFAMFLLLFYCFYFHSNKKRDGQIKNKTNMNKQTKHNVHGEKYSFWGQENNLLRDKLLPL